MLWCLILPTEKKGIWRMTQTCSGLLEIDGFWIITTIFSYLTLRLLQDLWSQSSFHCHEFRCYMYRFIFSDFAYRSQHLDYQPTWLPEVRNKSLIWECELTFWHPNITAIACWLKKTWAQLCANIICGSDSSSIWCKFVRIWSVSALSVRSESGQAGVSPLRLHWALTNEQCCWWSGQWAHCGLYSLRTNNIKKTTFSFNT